MTPLGMILIWIIRIVKLLLKHSKEFHEVFKAVGEIDTVIAISQYRKTLPFYSKPNFKVGSFSRGGKSRVKVKAKDHDFGYEYVVPFGIMNVKEKTTDIYLSETKVTADFIVDRLEEYWEIHGHKDTGKMMLFRCRQRT